MSLLVACPSCKGQCQAPDNAAGRKVRCPRCGAVLDVPAPASPPQARPAPSPVPSSVPVTPLALRPKPSAAGESPLQGNRVPQRVWLLAAGGGALAVTTIVIIAILAVGGRSSGPTKDDQTATPPITPIDQEAKKDPPKPTEQDVPKPVANKQLPEPAKEAATGKPTGKPKDKPRPANQDQLLRDATALQAPPLGREDSNINTFASQMRKLASDEFAFKDAQARVFRASFDRKQLHQPPTLKATYGRNVIVFPGSYDFKQQRSTWLLHFYHDHQDRHQVASTVFAEATDSCALHAAFALDEATARKWREAFDKGSLRVTVWFRLASVEKRAWQKDPRWLDGRLMHDLIFQADVLHAEYTTDGTEPVLKAPR